jgi:N-acetyl-gamma-glutamylphosphate reductase
MVCLNSIKPILEMPNIANPGCFATAIQLVLLPLAAKGLLKTDVHINATTVLGRSQPIRNDAFQLEIK